MNSSREETIIDYTHCLFDQPTAIEPTTRTSLVGVGYDEEGVIVVGEVTLDPEDHGPVFAGQTLALREMAPYTDGRLEGRRPQAMQVRFDHHTSLRGDRANRCLHELRCPVELLNTGDAVLVIAPSSEDDLGRYDAVVAERGEGRLLVDSRWYDIEGQALDGSDHRLISTTTLAGDFAYGDMNNEINAQLYLIADRVGQWNPDSPEVGPKIEAWQQSLRVAAEEIHTVESGNEGPTSLLNAASDLNLTIGRLDQWMRETGAKVRTFGGPTAAHAALIHELEQATSHLDPPTQEDPEL